MDLSINLLELFQSPEKLGITYSVVHIEARIILVFLAIYYPTENTVKTPRKKKS